MRKTTSKYLKVTNFYRYICLRFWGFMHFTGSKFAILLHLMTFITVSSQIKFLLVLNFAVWDTIAKKAKINTSKQL